MILAAMLLAVLHHLGSFAPMDRWMLGLVNDATDDANRASAPVLVALDDRLIERWGPPPWHAERWAELARALGTLGVQEAWLVDPVDRVLVPGSGASSKDSATILAPTVLVPSEAGLAPVGLAVAQAPLAPWDAQLYLPAQSGGVVRDLTHASNAAGRFGPSVFCDWVGRCPRGGELGQPIRPAALRELPTLSGAALLDGLARLAPDEAASRTVLVGLTAPVWSQTLHATSRAEAAPWAQVVGAAVASARISRPAATWTSAQILVLLVAVVLVAGRVHRTLPARLRTTWLAAAPLAVGGLAVGAYVLGVVVPPLTALLCCALLPSVVTSLYERQRFDHFLEDVRRQVLRDRFQLLPRAHPVTDDQALLVKLGALTRGYCKTDRCALFRVRDGQVALAGAYQLDEGDFRWTGGAMHDEPWATVFRRPHVGEIVSDLFVRGDLHARLVPLFAGEIPVAVWCIPFTGHMGPPSAQVVAQLVEWLVPRLQLDGADDRDGARVGFDAQLHDNLDLVAALSEERRQQDHTLRYLAWPLLLADVSGSVTYTNQALQRLMLETDLVSLATVRELLYRLRGEPEVGRLSARLFASREPMVLSWEDGLGRHFHVHVRPLQTGDDGQVIGYVALFQDVTASERVKLLRTRALEATSREVQAQLARIRRILDDGADAALAARTGPELVRLGEVLDELRSVAGFEVELDQPMPSNLGGLVQLAIDGVRDLALERQVRVELDNRSSSRPAMLVPTRAQRVLTDLLVSVVRGAPHGAQVAVRLSEEEDAAAVEVEWPGPGLDERSVALVTSNDPAEVAHLPPRLAVFGKLREVFDDLQVFRTDRFSTTIRLRAARS